MSSRDPWYDTVPADAYPPGQPLPNTLTDREKQVNEDYEWCLHDLEVRRAYAGQTVAAHGRRIWGVGPDPMAALEAARQTPGCPARWDLAVLVVPDLPPAGSEGGA